VAGDERHSRHIGYLIAAEAACDRICASRTSNKTVPSTTSIQAGLAVRGVANNISTSSPSRKGDGTSQAVRSAGSESQSQPSGGLALDWRRCSGASRRAPSPRLLEIVRPAAGLVGCLGGGTPNRDNPSSSGSCWRKADCVDEIRSKRSSARVLLLLQVQAIVVGTRYQRQKRGPVAFGLSWSAPAIIITSVAIASRDTARRSSGLGRSIFAWRRRFRPDISTW
jgi:hypothetical protein